MDFISIYFNVCYLFSEPKRTSVPFDVKMCAQTNAHVVVQFGLSLFQFMLKREMLKSAAFSPFVDPFVPLVMNSMISEHVKVCSYIHKH